MKKRVLLWLMLFVTGVGLFLYGFLLCKKTFNNISSSLTLLELDKYQNNTVFYNLFQIMNKTKTEQRLIHQQSVLSSPKLFFFIIDGLRYDFLESSHNFPNLHALMERNNKSQSRLFRTEADSPTTTSQRLKGIMTGGIPAFIEIGRA